MSEDPVSIAAEDYPVYPAEFIGPKPPRALPTGWRNPKLHIGLIGGVAMLIPICLVIVLLLVMSSRN